MVDICSLKTTHAVTPYTDHPGINSRNSPKVSKQGIFILQPDVVINIYLFFFKQGIQMTHETRPLPLYPVYISHKLSQTLAALASSIAHSQLSLK
jgi:hypothetical protein